MKLFRLEAGGEIANCATPASLDDLREALAEHGYAAVPVEPTEAMMSAVDGAQAAGIWPEGICRDIIAAAQEQK